MGKGIKMFKKKQLSYAKHYLAHFVAWDNGKSLHFVLDKVLK